MSTLTAFNNTIQQLIDDLINYFPEDNDYKLFESSFKMLRQANPRKVLELFKTHILKHKNYILDENESFLLEYNYLQSGTGIQDMNYAESLMLRIKDNWRLIDEKNKEAIWKYFKVLIVLSEK